MAEVITSPTDEILGDEVEGLLNHGCQTISKDTLHLPGSNFVECIRRGSDHASPTTDEWMKAIKEWLLVLLTLLGAIQVAVVYIYFLVKFIVYLIGT